MSILRKIRQSFGKGKLKKEQEGTLYRMLQDAVLDGNVSDSELKQINSLYYQSELSDEEFSELKEAFFWQVVETLISDRRISDIEKSAFKQISNKLTISPSVLQLAEKEVSYFSLLHDIETAKLPSLTPQDVLLKKDEIAHFDASASMLEERVVDRQYVGGSRGVSIRTMKGVSYRVGANRGKLINEKGLVPISDGNFVATNQRLMFSGDKKSFAHPYSKLIDLQLFSDAIQFSVSNRQRPFIVGLYSDRAAEVGGAIISKILNS